MKKVTAISVAIKGYCDTNGIAVTHKQCYDMTLILLDTLKQVEADKMQFQRKLRDEEIEFGVPLLKEKK